MQTETLLYAVNNRVCTITLNRPDSLNSFNHEMRMNLPVAIKTADQDPNVRVIILKGAGKGFCSGADLSEGLRDDTDVMLREEYKPGIMSIQNASKPVIAQVHGGAAGIGAAYAMACDMVIMAEDAYFYLAFAAIGLVPDGGLNWQIYHALGRRRAFETIVEGKRLTAPECLAAGICNQSVPIDELEDTVWKRAQKLASGAPLAQAEVKNLLRQMGTVTLSQAIDMEAEAQKPLTQTEDCQNAVAAFFRKEKPVFEGR